MSIDGASHEALSSMSDTEIDVRNRILAGNFGGKAPSRPEVVQMLEPDSVCQVHGIRAILAAKLFQASSSKTSNRPLLLPDQRKPRPNSRRGAPLGCSSGADSGGISCRFQRESQRVGLILTRRVSEGLFSKTRQCLSLTDVSGCENPLNQQPDQQPGFGDVVVGRSLNRVAVGLADHSGSWTTAPERS